MLLQGFINVYTLGGSDQFTGSCWPSREEADMAAAEELRIERKTKRIMVIRCTYKQQKGN